MQVSIPTVSVYRSICVYLVLLLHHTNVEAGTVELEEHDKHFFLSIIIIITSTNNDG